MDPSLPTEALNQTIVPLPAAATAGSQSLPLPPTTSTPLPERAGPKIKATKRRKKTTTPYTRKSARTRKMSGPQRGGSASQGASQFPPEDNTRLCLRMEKNLKRKTSFSRR